MKKLDRIGVFGRSITLAGRAGRKLAQVPTGGLTLARTTKKRLREGAGTPRLGYTARISISCDTYRSTVAPCILHARGAPL